MPSSAQTADVGRDGTDGPVRLGLAHVPPGGRRRDAGREEDGESIDDGRRGGGRRSPTAPPGHRPRRPPASAPTRPSRAASSPDADVPRLPMTASRLRPPARSRWKTASRALTAWRARAAGARPATAPSASRRAGTSARPFACRVPAPPSCPVFSAERRSRTSTPRTLAHDEAVGTHAERFPQQPCEVDAAHPLEVRLARLERDHVGMDDPELGDVLDGDDAVARRRRRQHGRQERGLAGASRARDEHVGSSVHARPDDALVGVGEEAGPAQVVERRGHDPAGSGWTAPCRDVEIGGRTTCTRTPPGSRTSTHGLASST